MKTNKPQETRLIRLLLAVCILASIGLMYYVNIVQKDYVVITSENGPVLSE